MARDNEEVFREVAHRLGQEGFQAYKVGGFVRDTLLGENPQDLDLATDAPVEAMVRLLGAVPVSSRSNMPTVIFRGLEISTFRSEHGLRKGGLKVSPGTMLEDAQRRDFTVNALYMSLQGEVLDPLGEGKKDLSRRELKFVGDPVERMREDPTRILRGYRLSSRLYLSFFAGRKAVSKNLELLDDLAAEQFGKELMKLLSISDGFHVAVALNEMQVDGVLGKLLPEVNDLKGVVQNRHHLEGDAFEHTLRVVMQVENDPNLRLAALLHDIGKKPTQKLKEEV